MEASYITAFLAGILGAAHCVGMCGGIVGALTLGIAQKPNMPLFQYILAYNLGRISSYVMAGFFLSTFSMLIANLINIHAFQQVLQFIAASLMLMLGLYLGGWWLGISHIENLGNPIWKKIEPFSRHYIPIQTSAQAFILGILWGWLPCGLVYTVLFMAIASANAVQGTLLMLYFGIGTLPALILMGILASSLRTFVQRNWVRKLAGASIVGFALYNYYRLALGI